MIVKSVRDLDIKIGLLVYARPEVYVGKYFRHYKSQNSFHVYEVSLDARIADPKILKHVNVTCRSGEVVEFVLCKEDLSTIDAVSYAEKALKLKLTYAGLKDAEARTCQFVRALCIDERELDSQYILLRNKNRIELYTVGKTGEPLARGSLLGNFFIILLNFVDSTREYDEALRALGNVAEILPKLSLPNFFGYQRFGTRRPTTHLIGKAIAECRFEEAVQYIVGYPLETESDKVIAARKAFEEGELSKSLKLFPRKFWIERFIIRKLMKGCSPREAVLSLDHKILKLYIEAYQAYLFNIMLSIGLLECGSIDILSRECKVLPLPGPNALSISSKGTKSGYCRDLIMRVLEMNYVSSCRIREVRRLFSKRVRPTYFKVSKLDYTVGKDNVWLRFELSSGSYATVLLRELLRENLILP